MGVLWNILQAIQNGNSVKSYKTVYKTQILNRGGNEIQETKMAIKCVMLISSFVIAHRRVSFTVQRVQGKRM